MAGIPSEANLTADDQARRAAPSAATPASGLPGSDTPPEITRRADAPGTTDADRGSTLRSSPGSRAPGAGATGPTAATAGTASTGGTGATGGSVGGAGARVTGADAGSASGAPRGGGDAESGPARPGVGETFRNTRGAFGALLRSHVDLFKAELGEIVGEVKRIAILGGAIVGVALFVGNLLFIGTILFLGEWLFGSIGWGVLHGTLLGLNLIVALALVLLGAGMRPAALGFVAGLVLGVVVGLVVGPLVTNVLDWRLAAAVGLTVGYLVWLAAQGLIGKGRIDAAARFGRLKPRVTMETTVETKDWLVQQWQDRRKKLARQ